MVSDTFDYKVEQNLNHIKNSNSNVQEAFNYADEYEGMNVDDLMNSTQHIETSDEETNSNHVSDSELQLKINKSLSKVENHWIFKSTSDEDGISLSK